MSFAIFVTRSFSAWVVDTRAVALIFSSFPLYRGVSWSATRRPWKKAPFSAFSDCLYHTSYHLKFQVLSHLGIPMRVEMQYSDVIEYDCSHSDSYAAWSHCESQSPEGGQDPGGEYSTGMMEYSFMEQGIWLNINILRCKNAKKSSMD